MKIPGLDLHITRQGIWYGGPPARGDYSVAEDGSRETPVRRTVNLDVLTANSNGQRYSNARRYSGTGEILRADKLYGKDSYAGELVGNVVDFAVGSGITVECGDEYCQARFDAWRPVPEAPLATFVDVQGLAARNLMVAGDIFTRRLFLDRMPLLQMLDGRNFPTYGTGPQREGGVEVDPYMRPLRYHYRFYGVGAHQQLPLVLEAHEVMHVFELEYSGQLRGASWLRRSLWALDLLAEFSEDMVSVARLALTRGGVFKVPENLYTEDTGITGDETDEVLANKVIALRQVRRVAETGADRTGWVPEGVTWEQTQNAGLTNSQALGDVYAMLIARAARGMGISPYALTADFGNSGYLTARYAVEADQRFYQRVQRQLAAWVAACVDFWAYTNAVMDDEFLRRWKGYQLHCPAFPFVDPAKEAAADKIELEQRTNTPQNILRRKGLNLEQVQREWREWEEFTRELGQAGAGPMQGQEEEQDGEV